MIQGLMKREVCGPCTKFINLGQPLLECEICFTAIHTKCYKKAEFSSANGLWTFKTGSENMLARYNPFPYSTLDETSDKFYDKMRSFVTRSHVLVMCCCITAL